SSITGAGVREQPANPRRRSTAMATAATITRSRRAGRAPRVPAHMLRSIPFTPGQRDGARVISLNAPGSFRICIELERVAVARIQLQLGGGPCYFRPIRWSEVVGTITTQPLDDGLSQLGEPSPEEMVGVRDDLQPGSVGGPQRAPVAVRVLVRADDEQRLSHRGYRLEIVELRRRGDQDQPPHPRFLYRLERHRRSEAVADQADLGHVRARQQMLADAVQSGDLVLEI